MSDALHRTTKVLFVSVNTPDYPTATYIINPDLSAVTGWANKYWEITGDVVTLMDAAARDAVDAAIAAQLITDTHAELTNEVDGALPLGVDIRALLQNANRRSNYIINRLVEMQNRVQAMLDSTGGVANMRVDGLAVPISPTTTRPLPEAIQAYKDDISAGLAN